VAEDDIALRVRQVIIQAHAKPALAEDAGELKAWRTFGKPEPPTKGPVDSTITAAQVSAGALDAAV
jgi:hypothetical protein